MEPINTKRCQSCGRKLQREEDKGINANGTRSEDYCHMCFMNGKFTHPNITKEEIIEQGAKDWSDHDQGMSYEQAKKELSKIIPKLKRWKKSSKKAIIISGLVAGIVAFLVGLILSLNPLVSGIYSGYGTIFKSIDFFSRMLLNFVGSLLSMVLLAVLYSYTEKSINIKSSWKKGLFFGFLFWLVSRVPGSYSLWLSFNYPDILNIIQTFNGFIVNVISGVSLATIYKKLK